MKYRKKPVVIEAWQFNGEDGLRWPQWLHDYQSVSGRVCYWLSGKLFIPTLEGLMEASPGDWIIRGVLGEIYPCKPDIFEMTYEIEVEDNALTAQANPE